MELRDYQQQMIHDVRNALKEHRKVLLQSSTGSGKTALAVYMMSNAVQRAKRCLFIVHQNELIKQTSRALWQQKLEHGIIASGRVRSPLPVQVASVQTLVNRLDQYDPFDLVIVDEAHRSAANTHKRIIDYYSEALIIGLTATPQRTDGKGLRGQYDHLVCGPSIRSLISAGWLADYDLFAPPIDVDLSDLKTTAGDYNKGELSRVMDKPTITGDAVGHYRKMADGKRCVVMCAGVDHAEHVAAMYRSAGIAADIIHGNQTDAERESRIAALRSGELKVLTNAQLLIEGVDVPDIEVVQWLRPTQSLIVWKQGNGRGFRPKPGGGRLIVLDHVGNWQRHGMPDDEPEWSLDGRQKRKRGSDEPDIGLQSCKACLKVFCSGVRVCPHCGAAVAFKEPRSLEVQDGELEKIEKAQESLTRRIEQGRASTIEELVAIGYRRGMKNCAGWAANVFAARSGRKAGPAEWNAARVAYIALRGQAA